MIRKARLISASHVELSAGSDTRRVEKTSIFSRRYALLTAASVLALSAVGPLEATAQTVSDIVATAIAVAIAQPGPSSNAAALAIAVANTTDTTDSPLVVFDSADAQSIAQSSVAIAVTVSQTTNGTSAGAIAQSNQIAFDLDVDSTASSGLVDITNTLIGSGTIALSQASSSIAVAYGFTQTNTNAGVSNVALTNQIVEQDNENRAVVDFDATATSGVVNVMSTGDVNEPTLDGINAASIATVLSATISSDVTQRNQNSLTGSTTGNNQPLTQNQSVDQDNLNLELLTTESEAEFGPVTVSRDGSTATAGIGVAANSAANASSEIDSNVNQSNENSASASTTGNGSFIAQAPVDVSLSGTASVTFIGRPFITVPFAGSLSFPGGQDVEQENTNGQIIAALSDADLGDVSVSSEGDTTAGINGVNALSTANAIAKVDSSVTQSNKNSLTASTQGGLGTLNLPVTINPGNNPHFNINIPLPVPAFIAQAQDVDQTNLNGQILIAASEAEFGDVHVSREGDTDAGLNGINAASAAVASAEVDSSVSQSNENSASATTAGDGAFIAQGPVDLSVPFSLSIGLGSGFAASLSGSLDTSFDGGQDVDQVNVNAQLIAAASSAVAGDVSVSSDGYMSAGGIGINAVSAATAGAAVDNSVTQSNTNSLTASTQGDLGLIDQSPGGGAGQREPATARGCL